jgi:serine/threonine-protein phosphatase 6 regulatory ankyrin repeat subunit A
MLNLPTMTAFENLLLAINKNDIDSASTLIANGFVNGDRHALLYAAAGGRVEIMALLLNAGADVNVVDKWERTACHYAVSNGHLAALEFLIMRGANLGARDHEKNSLLSRAICRRSDKFAIALLDAGAPLDGLNLDELVRAAAKSPALIKSLLARGVNVCHLRNSSGQTPCHVVDVESEDFEAIMRHLVCVVGIDVNSVDRFGKTPLHILSFMINVNDSAMRGLIELGADVDRRDDTEPFLIFRPERRVFRPEKFVSDSFLFHAI